MNKFLELLSRSRGPAPHQSRIPRPRARAQSGFSHPARMPPCMNVDNETRSTHPTMYDPVNSAYEAQQNLSTALQALQAPTATPQLSPAAEPVAAAMSQLHKVRASGGDAATTAAPVALDAAREALAFLQSSNAPPEAATVAEAVAQSLGVLHELVQVLNPNVPAPEAPRVPAPEPPTSPLGTRLDEAALAGTGDAEPTLWLEASLTVDSETNFYVGLVGADAVKYGGLFVASQSVPDLGKAVALRVRLPAGIEFRVTGVVAWSRGSRRGGRMAGFGVRFTQISDEGAALVRRYITHRAPMLRQDDA